MAVILLHKNVSSAYVGIMGALMSLTSTLIQPLWGLLCDRYGWHRMFYCIAGCAMPLLYLWIFRSSGTAALIVCALLSGMFINSIQNMGNGWVAGLNSRGFQINYGLSRGAGSLAYAVMAVVFGLIMTSFGVYGLIAGMAACGLICGAVSFTIPAAPHRQRPGAEPPLMLSEGLQVLLADTEYVVVIFCAFLAMFGTAGLSSYYAVHLSGMGASATVIGVGTFAYALAEVPFMFFFGTLSRRFSFRTLFAAALISNGLQCALVGLSVTCLQAILAMTLQGAAFGMLVPCMQQYTAQRIDDKYISTAQLFSTAVSFSASMIFGNLAASFLNRYFDLRATFLILSCIPMLGLFIILTYTARHSPKNN